jgi:spore maturation protein CgeB
MAADSSSSPRCIVVEQARRFAPDVLMFNSPDETLLSAIQAACPSLCLTFGWVGSALGLRELWRRMDFMLSCAPESVEELRRRGAKAEHLNHAFDSQINALPLPFKPEVAVSFVGTIVRRGQFHLKREEILEAVAQELPLEIFTPSSTAGVRDYAKAAFSGGLHAVASVLGSVGLLEPARHRIRAFGRVLPFASPMKLPINRRLARISRPAVYGMDYYAVLRQSRVSLNIHADSSPRFASNIRLFEATGVGSCLLTDWKPNLGDLFELDREVVAYRSAIECRAQAKWLLEHPRERLEIARRGQARALRDHNFEIRARELDGIIKRHLKIKGH